VKQIHEPTSPIPSAIIYVPEVDDNDTRCGSEEEDNASDGSYVNESAGSVFTMVTISTEGNTESEWASMTDLDTLDDAINDVITDDAEGNDCYRDIGFIIFYIFCNLNYVLFIFSNLKCSW